MGGGDLNLKKSWHPSTMRNMEKVWQAEQRHEMEQKRIAELQRELREEREREEVRKYAEDQGVIEKKDGTKLDWMYQGPGGAVDREEYLLGRAVDRTLEDHLQTEKSGGVTSSSRMHPLYDGMPTPLLKTVAGPSGEQVDMVRKLLEDPLSAIRKKEIETRTQLLTNPVKLKQLQQMLQDQKKQAKESKKKHKKEKKHKKKKRHHASSESGETPGDLDKLLAHKYSRLRRRMEKAELEQALAPSSSEDEDVARKIKQEDSDSDSNKLSTKRKKTYGLVLPAGASKNSSESRRRSRSRSPRLFKACVSTKPAEKKVSRKLTQEEKDARLREMQSNANWRDSERQRSVQRYRDEERREKDHHQQQYDTKFINKQLSKAAAQGTVEGRIRSNMNYIQRSGAAMDKNFARR